jgi:pyruvate dehydrogenase E2 component (dihydrolipoamide acetyltransferase)
MAELVIMPKLGFNMDEGQLVKWHKKEGEEIKKGEILFEILTDKTTMEIEATTSGVVRKLLIDEGQTVPVTTPIAIIGDSNEDISLLLKEAKTKIGCAPENHEESTENIQNGQEKNPENNLGNKLSPRAKKYIKEKGIDITHLEITGTGYNGGITERDLIRYVEANRIKITPLAKKIAEAENIDVKELKGSGHGGRIVKSDIESTILEKSEEIAVKKEDKVILKEVPYTGIRKVIGERMSQSKFTAPHVYFRISADVTKLLALREMINNAQQTKISITDFLVAGAAKVLVKHPELNSSLEGDKIVQYKSINIGIAVGLENGLFVPVIKNVQNKTVTQISQEAKALVEKARNGKLLPEEYKGGTFTISNLGMFEIEEFTAIINQPEAAILAVGSIIETPVVIKDGEKKNVEIRPIMKLTLSADHRIFDGMKAALFMKDLKNILENPILILV